MELWWVHHKFRWKTTLILRGVFRVREERAIPNSTPAKGRGALTSASAIETNGKDNTIFEAKHVERVTVCGDTLLDPPEMFNSQIACELKISKQCEMINHSGIELIRIIFIC